MKNNQSCQVSPDEQGNAIRVSKNNAEYGHVRLTQNRVTFNTNGWVNKKTLTTLIHGTVEDLQAMNFSTEQPLNGKIVVREQLEPFNTNDPDRDLKMAGDTGIVCCEHGQPIYRKTFYDASGTMEDTYVAHTNGDAIREANADNVEAAPNVAEPKAKSKAKKQEEVVEEPVEEVVEMEEETFEL
jgi:hypothetical protein